MNIRTVRRDDRDELVRMRRLLWPDSEAHEVDGVLNIPTSEGVVLVADRTDGGLGGFAEVGLRKFADGCRSSPVAYLEGIWIDEDSRRGGVGSDLVRAAEAWAQSRGLREFASDCELENAGSEAFHLAAGFDETLRGICFRRDLDPLKLEPPAATATLEQAVREEVESIHDFFVGWFSGSLASSAFESEFLSRFDRDFVLIPPTGASLTVDDLSARIFEGRATNPNLRISIRNVIIRHVVGDQILATYEEWQRNPLAAPSENARVATVVFRNEQPLRWLHVHETWLPETG